MSAIDDELKERMRRFLGENAQPMRRVSERSIYGTTDWSAAHHLYDGVCKLVVPPGTMIREITRGTFAGTFEDSPDEVGLEAEGIFCACEMVGPVGIRWVGGFGELIRALTDPSSVEGSVRL